MVLLLSSSVSSFSFVMKALVVYVPLGLFPTRWILEYWDTAPF